MARVVVIFDVDREPSEYTFASRGEGFLDLVEAGVKFGLSNPNFSLGKPVRIVRSIVTGSPERVVIVNPQVPGRYLQLSPSESLRDEEEGY